DINAAVHLDIFVDILVKSCQLLNDIGCNVGSELFLVRFAGNPFLYASNGLKVFGQLVLIRTSEVSLQDLCILHYSVEYTPLPGIYLRRFALDKLTDEPIECKPGMNFFRRWQGRRLPRVA